MAVTTDSGLPDPALIVGWALRAVVPAVPIRLALSRFSGRAMRFLLGRRVLRGSCNISGQHPRHKDRPIHRAVTGSGCSLIAVEPDFDSGCVGGDSAGSSLPDESSPSAAVDVGVVGACS